MSTKTILYNFWRSSCSWRVRLALKYKKIHYEYISIDLMTKENLKEEYRKISPYGHVPVLSIDNMILVQSLPICEYLQETRHNQGFDLLPSNNIQKYKIRSFCEMINAQIQPLQSIAT
eukprot:409805_1